MLSFSGVLLASSVAELVTSIRSFRSGGRAAAYFPRDGELGHLVIQLPRTQVCPRLDDTHTEANTEARRILKS